MLTTAYFVVDEEYFQSSHVTGEPAASIETSELEADVQSTLILQGLNAQTVSMTATQINTGMVQVIEWRVELTYLGDPIAVDNNVVAAIGSSIMALGAAHQNSLWRENADHTGLTTVSHAPVR